MKREKKQQRWTCSMIVLLAMLLVPKTAWAVNGTLTTRTVAGDTYYEIADAKDLAAFSNLVSSRNTTTVTFHMNYNAILTNDITWDTSLTFNTIGVRCDDDMSYGTQSYTGIFDGNGHTIRSLRITKLRRTGTPYCGMFAALNGATVKNLTLTDVDFDNSGGYRYDGPISGSATGSTLSNVYVEGAAKSSGYWSYAAGLVGTSSGCTYTNCGANLVFTLIQYDGILAAGLVYQLSGKNTFTNCYFYGSFTGLKQGYYDLEGTTYTITRQRAYPIYAENSGTATFTNCYAVTFQGNYGSEYTARNTNTGITYKEPSAFTSGEVAYLLNGSTNGGTTWRQNITSGTVDNCPVLDQTHNKVYYLQDKYCTGANKGNAYYSNNSSAVTGVHTSLSKTAAKDATCTEAGNYDYWTCSGCKKVYSNANGTIATTVAVRTIAALGHGSTGYDEIYTWSGTCYNDATKDTKACKFSLRCKKCSTYVVNNSYLTCTLTAHTDATCTTTGKTTYSATGSFTSTNSSYNYSATKTNDYTIAALGHKYTTYTYNNDVTCVKAGTTTATCDYGCGTTDTKDDPEHPATGHNLTTHDKVDATCSKAGNVDYWSCSVCNNLYDDPNCETAKTLDDVTIAPLGHIMTGVAAKAATLETEGNEAYWTCSRSCCEGKYYKNNLATTNLEYEAYPLKSVAKIRMSVQQNGSGITEVGAPVFALSNNCRPRLKFVDGKAVMTVDDHSIATLPTSDGGQLVVEFKGSTSDISVKPDGKMVTVYSPFQLEIKKMVAISGVYIPEYIESSNTLKMDKSNEVNDIIPAGTGIIVKGNEMFKEEGFCYFSFSSAAPTVKAGSLGGTALVIANPTKNGAVDGKRVYTVGHKTGSLSDYGFYSCTADNLAAGHAFLYGSVKEVRGDLSKNKNITVKDMALLVNILKGTDESTTEADVNNDGFVTLDDEKSLADIILNYISAVGYQIFLDSTEENK